jgi:hypothetical protein
VSGGRVAPQQFAHPRWDVRQTLVQVLELHGALGVIQFQDLVQQSREQQQFIVGERHVLLQGCAQQQPRLVPVTPDCAFRHAQCRRRRVLRHAGEVQQLDNLNQSCVGLRQHFQSVIHANDLGIRGVQACADVGVKKSERLTAPGIYSGERARGVGWVICLRLWAFGSGA